MQSRPLSIIGAGFSRTGTFSLKLALERLGLGPCYHMHEFFLNPHHAKQWRAAAGGDPVDWSALFAGYQAAVDAPTCHFWRELSERFPEARVVLTVREPERWYASMRATIYEVMQRPELVSPEPRVPLETAGRITFDGIFGGRFEDEVHATRVYLEHIEDVERTLPRHRLLVYRVAEGWKPLCRFLGRSIPDEPFPRTNTTEAFRTRLGLV